MEAKDLRIGNWVMYEHAYQQVVGYNSDGYIELGFLKQNSSSTLTTFFQTAQISGIPLTEEWLVKMGFSKQPTGYGINISQFNNGLEYKQLFVDLNQGIIIRQGDANQPRGKDDLVSVYNVDISGKIMVHTLQNWFNLLTQTELIINTEKI